MNQQTTLTTEERSSGLRVIIFHGDLDSVGVKMVEEAFASAVPDRSSRIVVDLGDVDFISSAGLAMLLIKGKALRQGGGSLTIASNSQHVVEVLELAGFEELFEIYSTLQEALAALERG